MTFEEEDEKVEWSGAVAHGRNNLWSRPLPQCQDVTFPRLSFGPSHHVMHITLQHALLAEDYKLKCKKMT
jgi:hypothetical protein